MAGNQHAYAVTNLVASLSDTAFVWSDATTTNRSFLHDGRMDQVFSSANDNGGVNVVIDLGSAKLVNAIALLNSNAASLAGISITIDSADDSAMSVNLVHNKLATTPNAQTPRDREHVLQFAALSKRYWRVTWTWQGTAILTLAEIFVCDTTQTQRYTIFGETENPDYLVDEMNGYTGESRALYLGGPVRRKSMKFEDLATSERDDFLTLLSVTKGGALPMLWCHLYDSAQAAASNDQQDCLFGRLIKNPWTWTAFDFQRYNFSAFEIESLARDAGH